MPASNPRVYVTLDKEMYRETKRLAKHKKVSMSSILRDRIKEAEEWRATYEILRDPEAMRTIEESLNEIRRGEKGTPWRELFKDV